MTKLKHDLSYREGMGSQAANLCLSHELDPLRDRRGRATIDCHEQESDWCECQMIGGSSGIFSRSGTGTAEIRDLRSNASVAKANDGS